MEWNDVGPAGSPVRILNLDHVQLATPPQAERRAIDFYCGVLGFEQVPKPRSMIASGGAWLRSGNTELHLGVDAEFRPARKAHLALVVDDLVAFARRCEAAGHAVEWDDRCPGAKRFCLSDPFGSRLELLHRPSTTSPNRISDAAEGDHDESGSRANDSR